GGGSSPPPESRTGWQPPEPEELARLLPQYAISHLIGRGGMGAVYQGVQLSLRREVAVKLLPPELGASPEFEARFRREAMAMARLNHPNIVQIHDYGQTAEGHHYIVMEYVDGTNLRHIIREGGLDA
ncbi:MAG TPA: protein kinase, partial [Bacteroidia bacterium]|nr:protein kinase [Bacteroidia bacterium]